MLPAESVEHVGHPQELKRTSCSLCIKASFMQLVVRGLTTGETFGCTVYRAQG